MRRTIALVAATAMSLAPAAVLAKPTTTPPTTNSISPAADTGQQNLECEDGGVAPGNPPQLGPGSPFQEDSVSGSHYAGEQVGVNDKNSASSSQYDVACFRPQH